MSLRIEAKTVVPQTNGEEVKPSIGYNYLSKVIVKAIPYKVIKNNKGADIVIIGGK